MKKLTKSILFYVAILVIIYAIFKFCLEFNNYIFLKWIDTTVMFISIIGIILLLFNHLRMALIYGHNYLCRVFVELSLSSVNVMGLILKPACPIISTKAPPPVL